MANKLKFSRGLENNLPAPVDGTVRFCTNTGSLYIDNNNEHIKVRAGKADQLTEKRTISLTGAITGAVEFDGSTDVIMNTMSAMESTQLIKDSEIAYSKDLPVTNVSKYATVTEIGGMTRKCTNLFDENNVTANQAIGTNGKPYNATEYCYSSPIAVSEGKAYRFQNIAWFNYYTDDKTPTDSNHISQNSGMTDTAPVGAKFVRLSVKSENIGSAMLNKGETAIPYEPYFTGLRDAKVTAVESVGVNLYCGSKTTEYSGNNITYKWDKEEQIITITSTSSVTTELFVPLENVIDIVGGETYSIKSVILENTSTLNWLFGICDSNRRYATSEGYSALSDITSVKTYTFAKDAHIDMLHIFVSSGGAGSVNVKFKLMLNKGTTALPYSPYFKRTFPIPEAVQALEGYGQGISKEYHNKIVLDPASGVKKFVKNVGVVDLGTLAWYLRGNQGNTFTADGTILGYKYGLNGLCVKYETSTRVDSDKTIFMYNSYLGNNIISITDTDYTDAATFKAAMNGVMLVYELATPTETDISDCFGEDNLIGVEAGGTIIAANEYEYDVPFTINYSYGKNYDVVSSKKFIGDLDGIATRAISDNNGNIIEKTYIPFTGGTFTGAIATKPNQYMEKSLYGLNMNNSDIVGINGLYFGDVADGSGEGLMFKSSDNNYDQLYAKDGKLYFTTGSTPSAFGVKNTVLHSGNYSSYALPLHGIADTATKLAAARTISLTGDVTGSTIFDGSGNVSITATVADDSHNHIISNVDGLQTTLDGKVNRSISTSADLNTITASGFYRVSNTNANMPSGGSYGQLIVSRGADTITQIIGAYGSGKLYTRSGNPSSIGGNGGWTDWKEIIDSSTISSQSVNYATSAGSATKATQDGSGNTITSTYLKLSGGTLTGRLTASGKISVPSSGSAWVSGMALKNASIAINTQNTDAAYHPLIAGKLYGGGVWNLGTITNKFGFYGFVSGHGSGNYTDYYMNIDGTTGKVEIKTYNSNVPLMLTSPSNETCLIDFYGAIGHLGSIGFASANGSLVRWNSGGSATYTILDSNNYSSYALPLSGGTMTGPLNTANGTYNKIGDDVSIGDINMAGTLGIIGQNGNTAIQLVNYGASTTTGTSATGVKWTCTGNGASTISGTTSGTFSGTLDGYSSSRFLKNLGGSNYITINVGGNANTYYPIVIDSVSDKFPMQFINISRVYYETAPSSWNTETHKGGLTLTLFWNGSRYWDGNGGGSPMYCVHKTETYTTMVAGLDNSTAGAVVWLRGGGAVYHIHSMNGTSATARVYLEGFTDSSSKTFSPTTTISNIAIRWPGWSSGADSASNADKLDGFHGSASSAANTYILRDSSNYIWTNYIHSDTVNNENPAIGQVIVTNGSDGFYRKASLSHLKSSLGNMPASYAVCHDVRGVDRAPIYYTDKTVTAWFNETGTPWNGNWFSGLTVKGWSDGYCSWQLSSYSSTGTTDDCLYYRMGTPGGAWQSWRQIPTIKTVTGSGAVGTITVANNTEYRYTGVTSLGINYPSGNFECWLRITVGSSAITLSFASGTSFIGTSITSLAANTSYEISIKDKVVIIKKVG